MLKAKQKYLKGRCAALTDQATLIVCKSALRGPPERPLRSFFRVDPRPVSPQTSLSIPDSLSGETARLHHEFSRHPQEAFLAHLSFHMLLSAANTFDLHKSLILVLVIISVDYKLSASFRYHVLSQYYLISKHYLPKRLKLFTEKIKITISC